MNPIKWKLHWQILAALLIAIILGAITNPYDLEEVAWARILVQFVAFFGDIFINALKMIIVPLIVSSIICGVMGIGKDSNIGRMGTKVIGYYALTGFLAIIVGLIMVNIIQPGNVDPETAEKIFGMQNTDEEYLAKFRDKDAGDIADVFKRMFPQNIIDAATDNGQLLGVIVFSLFFGYFIAHLPQKSREFQGKLWESIMEVMLGITDFIIRFTPIGVIGLVTPVIQSAGWGTMQPLLAFALTVLLALGFHMFVTLSLLLKFGGGISPTRHLRAMAPVLMTAFSTASSSGTLPLTMETVERDAGVSGRTASFTLPLGATVNMDGTALYECVVVIFIAQLYAVIQGFTFGIETQFLVVVMALLTSIGVAGIPSASLVAIAVILSAVGIPVEAVAIVWLTDRILDMCRTSVNVYSDTCGAVIIARSEGESGVYSDADPHRAESEPASSQS